MTRTFALTFILTVTLAPAFNPTLPFTQNVAFMSYVFLFVDYKKTWPKLFDFSQYESERVMRYLSLLFSLTAKMALDEWVYSISAMIAAFIGPVPVAVNSIMTNLYGETFRIVIYAN